MKFNCKSRRGFTLIELLVVIGILAVLAAIAIPSVAGLIDRANVSADNTNANEMTNAMERFASEYELFRQDIASGTFNVTNMDAAQGRVYNVTKAKTLEDIGKLEGKSGLNGIRIDIDTKYAQNHMTAKSIMENYMKTSSSTFEPKQSDMTYWYNTVTGYTIVAEKDVNVATLYDLLPSEVKYGNEQTTSVTDWIDLSSPTIIPDVKILRMEKMSEGGGKIRFVLGLPNPKNCDVDFTKVYQLVGSGTSKLDMENHIACANLYSKLTEDNKQYIQNSTNEYIEIGAPCGTYGNWDEVRTFRLAYEYEEDGQTRYVYSAIFATSYNDLP